MYAVIMAGGGGTRLWPLSRARRPKPFLPLLEGGRSLLEATVDRLAPLVEPGDVFVVTDDAYAGMVRELVPQVPAANLVAEPLARNTAAAVALAAHGIERAADDVMVVLPADQAIGDPDGFRTALVAAADRAAEGDMVTLGVQPTEPATGYGYVIALGPSATHGGRATYRVARFEEKPTPERAEALMADGQAYWNAGIFVWRRSTVVDGLSRYAWDISQPIADGLAGLRPSAEQREHGWPGRALSDAYSGLRSTSIDYALLEPASLDGRVAVVPAAVDWSDLGSWSALRGHRSSGEGSTVVSALPPARVIDVDGRDVLVHAAGGRLVAVVGLEDIIVVDTPDALLVSSSQAAQDVRQVVDRLKAEGLEELL